MKVGRVEFVEVPSYRCSLCGGTAILGKSLYPKCNFCNKFVFYKVKYYPRVKLLVDKYDVIR